MPEGANRRKRLLLVDDDRDFVTWLRLQLEIEGYDVVCAFDGEMAFRRVERDRPDLVLLDIVMPKMNGREVSRQLRRLGSRVPIIMLSRLNEPHQVAGGLDDGADDYVVKETDDHVDKPFELPVLLARIRARLRAPIVDPSADARYLRVGDYVFDREAGYLFASGGEPLRLSPKVRELLRYFLRNRNQLLTRQQILEAVWGFDFDGSARVVDQHVSRLNLTLWASAEAPRLIRAVQKEGYIFDGTVEPISRP